MSRPARSPPTRGRGLKQLKGSLEEGYGRVAPYTGARIETAQVTATVNTPDVAPYTGARIETPDIYPRASAILSPPTRGRGLKHPRGAGAAAAAGVAPYTGARIETRMAHTMRSQATSPPTRGRGLKPARPERPVFCLLSPPTRGRGLKLGGTETNAAPKVGSPPTRGRGLKRERERRRPGRVRSPPTRGRGLKRWRSACGLATGRRPLHGGAD